MNYEKNSINYRDKCTTLKRDELLSTFNKR